MCGKKLYRGCMSSIFYIKNDRGPVPVCNYYLEIFLLLFISAGGIQKLVIVPRVVAKSVT